VYVISYYGPYLTLQQGKLVEAAVALYRGHDENNRREADRWITKFQCSVEAWGVADSLLQLEGNES
jgi:hypothetical protein